MEIKEYDLKFSDKLTQREETSRIIIHHTASGDVSAKEIHQWHLDRGWFGIGYHFNIREDGTVERGRPIDTIGAHTERYNVNSIGIALAGNFNEHEPTSVQLKSLNELVVNLQNKSDNQLEIGGHCDYDKTDCPGKLFPLERVKERLGPGNSKVTWKVNGNTINVPVRLVNGRTEACIVNNEWIPLRSLAESLGFSIKWSNRNKVVEFIKE